MKFRNEGNCPYFNEGYSQYLIEERKDVLSYHHQNEKLEKDKFNPMFSSKELSLIETMLSEFQLFQQL